MDPVLSFDGAVQMTSGPQPQTFIVPAAQGYNIHVQGHLDGDESAWQIEPQTNAGGAFDLGSGEWWLHTSETMANGTVVTLHLEGELLLISTP